MLTFYSNYVQYNVSVTDDLLYLNADLRKQAL